MQTSVHNAHRTSFRRPVARTARTNSVSSQELTVVRSSGESSSNSSASSGSVDSTWPDATLTVEWTAGTPNAFTVRRTKAFMDSSGRQPRHDPMSVQALSTDSPVVRGLLDRDDLL